VTDETEITDAFKADLDALLAKTQARSELIDAVGWALADEAEKLARLLQQNEIVREQQIELMRIWRIPLPDPEAVAAQTGLRQGISEAIERARQAVPPMPRVLRSAQPN